MQFKYSLQTRLIIAFMGVMLPLVVFMLINHFYARDTVREKVSETYTNTLDIFVRQMDNNLLEIDKYLLRLSVLDLDVGLITSFPLNSDYYSLTKVKLDSKLKRDMGIYNIDTIFLYHEQDIIYGTNSDYQLARELIDTHMSELIAAGGDFEGIGRRWEVRYDQRVKGNYFLMNALHVSGGMYAGAIIPIEHLHQQLTIQWSDGDIGHGGIFLRSANKLHVLMTEEQAPITQSELIVDKPYLSVRSEEDGQKYLVMHKASQIANVVFQVVVPEATLLRDLAFFQNVALFAPVGFTILLALYWLLMRQWILRPLRELIFGMKKLTQGFFDVRLKSNAIPEIAFVASTFNKMAEQITVLKIENYEKQLNLKQGELKQLQAQINPHFYMNSLNIIYNLAVLGDTESVKKMSLHLADYFRFIMRSGRDTIRLSEELEHIENYLTIQKIRFPDKLACTVKVEDGLMHCSVVALTAQPFVENAIIHGFKNRRRLFEITIEGKWLEEGRAQGQRRFSLRIADNGVGFSKEALERLNRREASMTDSGGLGIVNVMNRLQLIYGSEASVSFFNQESGGAVVALVLPERAEGENTCTQ